MSMMHKQDQQTLARICGEPFSPKLRMVYGEFQRARSHIRSGPMEDGMLITIAVLTGSVRAPQVVISPLAGVDVGTPVKVVRSVDRSIVFGGIFVGHSPHEGFEKIAFQGDRHDIREVPVHQVELYPAGTIPEWMQTFIPPEALPNATVVPESYKYDIPEPPPTAPQSDGTVADVSNHPFSRVEPGTIVQVNTERNGVIKAYFRGIGEDGTVIVRTMTGPKKGRDKRYGTDLVIIDRDDDDLPIVDVAGMIEAGPEEETAPA